MSSTRHAPDGAPLNQERWASFPASAPIKPTLVALAMDNAERSRNKMIDPKALDLAWSLQGLTVTRAVPAIVEDLLALGKVGTKAMRQIGCERPKCVSQCEARRIRQELKSVARQCDIPGGAYKELEKLWDLTGGGCLWMIHDDSQTTKALTASESDELTKCCERAARQELGNWLVAFCQNPDCYFEVVVPWYFADIIESLRDYMAIVARDAYAHVVTTAVVRTIREALEAARYTKLISILEANQSCGRTFAAQHECTAYPGRFRMVRTPTGNGLGELADAILEAFGSANNRNYKTEEKKKRIRQIASAPGAPVLVFNQGQYLFPQTNLRRGHPERLEFVLSLRECGLSICIIADEQFRKNLDATSDYLDWDSAVLEDYVSKHETLDAALTQSELGDIAAAMMPAATRTVCEGIAASAFSNHRGLAFLTVVKGDAVYYARRRNRAITSADVAEAYKSAVAGYASLIKKLPATQRRAAAPPAPDPSDAPARVTQGQKDFAKGEQTSPPTRQQRGNIRAVDNLPVPG